MTLFKLTTTTRNDKREITDAYSGYFPTEELRDDYIAQQVAFLPALGYTHLRQGLVFKSRQDGHTITFTTSVRN